MNLKIKLKNPKYCNGCACLTSARGLWGNDYYTFCKRHYFEVKDKQFVHKWWISKKQIRPQKCIKENGR